MVRAFLLCEWDYSIQLQISWLLDINKLCINFSKEANHLYQNVDNHPPTNKYSCGCVICFFTIDFFTY